MTPDIEDLRPSILFQITTAFAKLSSPLGREQLEGMTPAEIYAAAEASGASIELLSTVGRWGDTLDDVDVLRHLHALNLFVAPVTTEDASFSQPDKPVTHPDYEKGGDTLDDVDVLRHLPGLNLFAAPVTTEDASFSQPENMVTHPDYEKGCREALAPHLDALIERAVAVGWDRSKVAFSLMYLAAKSSRASARGAP